MESTSLYLEERDRRYLQLEDGSVVSGTSNHRVLSYNKEGLPSLIALGELEVGKVIY